MSKKNKLELNFSVEDLVRTSNRLMEIGNAISKSRITFDEPKRIEGMLGLKKQKDGSVKTVFAGSRDYKKSQ